MKRLAIFIFSIWIGSTAFAQLNLGFLQVDSLRHELSIAKHDTSRVLIMANLAEGYRWSKPDSAMYFGQQALELARQKKYLRGEANALISISVVQRELGNLPKALDFALKALEITRKHHYKMEEISALIRVANVYNETKNYEKGIQYIYEAEKKSEHINNDFYLMVSQWLLADSYSQLNKLDSAMYYAKKGYREDTIFASGIAFTNLVLANILVKLNRDSEALSNYWQGLQIAAKISDYRTASNLNINLANFYKRKNQPDSAIYYAKQGLATAQILSYKNRIMNAANTLAELYESTDPKEALKYYKIANAAKDSLYSVEKVQALESRVFDEKERQHEVETAKTAYKNKIRLYILIGGLAVFLFIILILYRNNKQKQKAHARIQKAYADLRATQQQLIQSEKMASLGELTAGIAHEIQNPLNFINNFSEVNSELIAEMKQEIDKGNLQEVKSIADSIDENEQKIISHGKRADAIVKGMLQHSRTSSGQKEPTDINALCDEYLRLAYHGLRAKDKSFNAKFETDLDTTIGKINVVPQDMGRVLLNLINNAFYAVNERQLKDEDGYQPSVVVSTAKHNGKIEIKVKDNGSGIPQKVMDKIFQPFFTTKPTGQGTGLGLSLSYDIVKAHGGELRVVTGEGKGAEFIITLSEK